MKTSIYIAGPITVGDTTANIHNAIRACSQLIDAGFAPFCPHLWSFVHLLEPREYEDWLALDLIWLEQCEAVLRLPGESPGADRETARADELGLPVFKTITDLLIWDYGLGPEDLANDISILDER